MFLRTTKTRLLMPLLLCLASNARGQNLIDPAYAYCGDCFCINGDADCPTGDQVPQMEFSYEYVGFLQSLEVTNAYELSCNPYEDDTCETTPPQNMSLIDLGDDAACGVKYDMTNVNDNQCPTEYSLVSYESVAALEADGATLTHHGACGVCSTTQDLAVYIQYTDLVNKGTECAIRGIFNSNYAVACYTEVGYTEPCATMWAYNGYNTRDRDNCLRTCIKFTLRHSPTNGPPPECTLADCLQCDEDKSGPYFAKVAARSRRRSGLLSNIARPCDAILLVNHTTPCDVANYALARVEEPTTARIVATEITPSPNASSPYAFCGDCHCINGDADCPTGDQVPQMEFSDEYVGFLQSLELTNPYELSCNPYEVDTCETTPPQNMSLIDLGDDAACGVSYDMSSLNDNQCPRQYSLVSYESVAALEADGATLTHHGACGVCSTTQDLAVYIQYTDLVEKGTECSIRGVIDFDDGVACYMEVGYTEACATMWIYNGYNTGDNCLDTCIQFTLDGLPNNAPSPECTLADCLQCNEDESGPLFAKVAARSRRRSGLLSTIARPCDDILLVNHTLPATRPAIRRWSPRLQRVGPQLPQ